MHSRDVGGGKLDRYGQFKVPKHQIEWVRCGEDLEVSLIDRSKR